MLFMLDGTLPCIIMLQLLSILKFILTSTHSHHLYIKNAFSAVPLLLRASDNSFRSDAVWFLAQMLFMLDGTLPRIIMLYIKNAFSVVPLLLRASDNSFRSDAIWFLL
jgi:hypothetical protein